MKNKNVRLRALIPTLFALSPVCAEVPQTVTVITGEELAQTGLQDLESIITALPTVRRDFSSTVNLTPAGRSPNGANATVLVDGTEAGTVGEGPVLGFLDPGRIERVEVLPGGFSAEYGRAANGGVINVVTKSGGNSFNLGGSATLPLLQDAFSQSLYTIESKNQCDQSNGEPQQLWTLQNKWDFGFQDFGLRGQLHTWGDKSDGFADTKFHFNPDLYSSKLLDPGLSFSYVGRPGGTSGQDVTIGQAGFSEANKLFDRINAHPDAPNQDKQDYIASLSAIAAFSGLYPLSDLAFNMGTFDPELVFQDFLTFTANRTEQQRRRTASRASTSADPGTPGPTYGPEAPDPRNPFHSGLSYPPGDMFDLGLCQTQAQRDEVTRLVATREAARIRVVEHIDFMRAPPYTAATRAELDADRETAEQAKRDRDAANDQLRTLWEQCLNPSSAATRATQVQADVQSDSPFPPVASGTASSDGTAGDFGFSAGAGYDLTDDFNIELHARYRSYDDDGNASWKPAANLGFSVHRKDWGVLFGLPFSPSAFLDQVSGASRAPRKTFTGANGIGTIGRKGLNLSYGNQWQEREFENDDWQLFADLDWGNTRSGLTFGIKYEHVPKHQFYHAMPGGGLQGASQSPATDPNEFAWLKNSYKSRQFAFGPYSYDIYSVPEVSDFDFSGFAAKTQPTHWGNDTCGDPGMADEADPYLSPGMSAVDSVDDAWALAHVGLSGDEPKLDEFATPIVVAVVDTGIDWNHLDFSWNNLWRNEDEIPDNGIDDDNNGYVDDLVGWNFTGANNLPWDYDGHGTFVAGMIAATQGNDVGIDGINGNAKIMVLKALNGFGRTRGSYLAEAIAYAADNGAHIVNLSVTGPGFPRIVQDAVDYARSKGVLVVAAAGNRAADVALAEPAPLRGVLMVAATDREDRRAAFSNVGHAIGVAAPGIDIVSLRARVTDFMFNGNDTPYEPGSAFLGDDARYYRSTGTSFSTAIVTGVASLVLSTNPELTPDQLTRVIEQSARDVEAPGVDRFTGYGLVDAKAALAADPAFYIRARLPLVKNVLIDGQWQLQVLGQADADQFVTARLELGQGEDPQAWAPVGDPITEPVPEGDLGTIPAAMLTSAGIWTVRLVVEHQNGQTRETRYAIDVTE